MSHIKYSPMEQRLWDTIPNDGSRVSTVELVNLIYPVDGRSVPIYARQSILDCANNLILKSDLNKEPLELVRSKPKGTQPIFFWKQPRGEK